MGLLLPPLCANAVISRLWQQHVLPGRPPPSDVYASWREHHDMMRRIGEVSSAGVVALAWMCTLCAAELPRPPLCCAQAARGAQLVAAIEEGHHLPGSDARWFLD